jgi:adenosylcobyric acid synthase
MGRTTRIDGARPAFHVHNDGGTREDGAVSSDLRTWGTYLHGVFDSDGFRKNFLDGIRKRKGIKTAAAGSYERLKQEGFDKLAAIVRGSIDIKKVYEILRTF